jgi:uncharacterized membrane protein YphA (DoxX/SURF4 family)
MLLRAVVGITLFAQGVNYFIPWYKQAWVTWTLGLLAVAIGVLLLIGYLTPFASVLMGFISVGNNLLWWFRPPSDNVFDSRLVTALATSIAVAILCLGPGAFSIDSRLFVRREIIIRDASHPGEP